MVRLLCFFLSRKFVNVKFVGLIDDSCVSSLTHSICMYELSANEHSNYTIIPVDSTIVNFNFSYFLTGEWISSRIDTLNEKIMTWIWMRLLTF